MFKLFVLFLSIASLGYQTCQATILDGETEILISGSVVSATGEPASNAIVSLCRHSQELSKGRQTTAGTDGHFEITIAASSKVVETMHLECKSADGSEIGFQPLRSIDSKIDFRAVELRLDKIKKAKMLVIDADEKPIKGANVCARLGDALGRVVSTKTDEAGIAELVYTNLEPVTVAFAWKDDVGFDFRLFQSPQQGSGSTFSSQKAERFKLDGASLVKLKVVDDAKQPLKGIKVYPLLLRKSFASNARATDLNLSNFTRFIQKQTDANGEVSFPWLPHWQKGDFTFSSFGGENLVHAPIYVDLATAEKVGDATKQSLKEVRLERAVPIRGRVVNADGKPVKGIAISVTGEGLGGTSKATLVQTDEMGNYEVHVAPNQICMAIVKDEQWASTPHQGFAVLPNTPVNGVDFKLRKATRIYGKVRSGFWLSEVPNHRVVIAQFGKSLKELPDVRLPEPSSPRKLNPNSRPSDTFETLTDAKGNFELFVGDGDFAPISEGRGKEFRISSEESYEMNIETTVRTPPRTK